MRTGLSLQTLTGSHLLMQIRLSLLMQIGWSSLKLTDSNLPTLIGSSLQMQTDWHLLMLIGWSLQMQTDWHSLKRID